jgi:streptogramin lyase
MLRAGLALALTACCVAAGPASHNGASLHVGGRPVELLAGQGSLWLVTCNRLCTEQGRQAQGRIIRIDPRTARVVASGRLPRPGVAAVGARGVYVTDFWRDRIRRIDPRTLRVTRSLKLRLPFRFSTRDNAFLPEAVAVGGNAVWVVTDRGALTHADLRLGHALSTVRLPPDAFGDPFGGIALGAGAVWLAESLAGVYRVDPRTSRIVARIRTPLRRGRFDATEVIPCGGAVLVLGARTSGGALTSQNVLARIRLPRNIGAALTPLPAGPLEVTCGAGSLWVAQPGASSIKRIDPHSGNVIEHRRARIGTALAFAGGRLWTVSRDGTVRQLGK